MSRRSATGEISSKGLVSNETLMDCMRRMLECIQSEYQYPVDTEFTINISDNSEYSIDLLQCRPLQIVTGKASVDIPEDVDGEKILLECKGASMGLSRIEKLDRFEDVVKEFDGGGELEGIVRVLKAEGCTLYHDINNEHLLVTL